MFCLGLNIGREAANERPRMALLIKDQTTGHLRECTTEDLQSVLTQLGLELVSAGTVNWSEHPDSAIMKAKISHLTALIETLSKQLPGK